MRKYLTALTLVCTVVAGAAYADQPITIRGLNLDSTVEDFEEAFGYCGTIPAENSDFYVCGGDIENETFGALLQIDRDGDTLVLMLSCSFINGCEYSVEDLAIKLSEGLNLPAPKLVQWEGEDVWAIDGPSGDRLMVTDSPEAGLFIVLFKNNYQRGLILE